MKAEDIRQLLMEATDADPFSPLWEAAVRIQHELDNLPYGCHYELEPGMVPDDCVIDTNCRDYCHEGNVHKGKEDCPYWRPRPITVEP